MLSKNIFTSHNLSTLIDLLIINGFIYVLNLELRGPGMFHVYLTFGWLFIALKSKFYGVNRYAKATFVVRLLSIQLSLFFLILYAYIGFFKQPIISRLALAEYFLVTSFTVSVMKFLIYSLQLKFRERFQSSFRKVVVIGKNKKTDQLINVFNDHREFGFDFLKQFSAITLNEDIDEALEYIQNNQVDEIYCSVSSLQSDSITKIIDFADNNLKTLKFIPDDNKIYSKKLRFEYLEYIPVLSLRDIPLHSPINAFFKRAFDIVFALLVIILLLSWLTPLLALIITLESKGPVFFRQKRNGVDNQEFFCYKFRSMTPNENADQSSATKNDMRVTRIGRIIRRTSIDELPQFYNVFFGSMSVVGPRPHMVKHTNEFADRIDKFMVRHFVKPGITGLAQVRGYRGEIETDADIQNRIKFDIFYIENWSLFLDIKIIVQTVLNVFRKEEKAY